MLALKLLSLHYVLYTVNCTDAAFFFFFSKTRHNVKTRKEFMKHQLLPSPPKRSETERKEKKEKRKKGQGGEKESFPAVERQKKRMDEECRSAREGEKDERAKSGKAL